MKLVCIGDSITAAQHLDEGESGWPALLTGYEVYMAGVPGDTTRLALERFPRDVQSRQPDLVVIQFGHNDCNRWQTDRGLTRVSPEAFAANLVEMADRCRAFGAKPYLCTLTPSGRNPVHAADTRRYDGILRDVAAARTLVLIDVSGITDTLDGIHLSAEGHRKYAAIVQAALP